MRIFDLRRLLLDLSNTSDEGLAVFRRKWNWLYRGYKNDELLRLRNELRMLWKWTARVDIAEYSHDPWLLTIDDDDQLFAPGSGDSAGQVICQQWLSREKRSILVDWTPTEKRMRANPQSLPAVLAWACVQHAEHLGLCRNLECANRYFIESRKDQRYCSPECAAPAKRAAKLRWWHQNRGKSPRHRKGVAKVAQTR